MQEAGFYSFVDDRTRDTFTLINVQRIVQPVVTYRGSEGCLGGDKKFIARPIRKGADGEEFSFCTFAISWVAVRSHVKPRVCILRQKRRVTSSAVAGPSDDWGGRTRASGAAAVSSGTCFQVGVNGDRLRITSAWFATCCCHRRAGAVLLEKKLRSRDC